MTAAHMQTLRNLAAERTLNADVAKYAVMNVAYGIKNLESHLHGTSLRKTSYAETGTKVRQAACSTTVYDALSPPIALRDHQHVLLTKYIVCADDVSHG